MKTVILTLAILASSLASSFAGATKGTYRCFVTTGVYYYNTLTGQFTNVRYYNSTATVTIGNPAVTRTGQRESNAFSLTAKSPSLSSGGAVTLSSAFAGDVGSVKNVLLQYWTFANTSTGFTGRLTNNGARMGMVMNSVNAWSDLVPGRPSLGGRIMPYSFYDAYYGAGYQTSLTATNTSTKLIMQVRGWSVAGSTLAYIITDISGVK